MQPGAVKGIIQMATTAAETLGTPRPEIGDMLTEFDLEQNRAGFVGMKLAPVIDVPKGFGPFARLKLKDILRKRVDTSRGAGGSYGRDSAEFNKDSYTCEDHGFEEAVDLREAEFYDSWIDAEVLAAERARNMVLQDYESRVVTLANAVTNTTAIGTDWKTTATCSPIDDIRTAKVKVRNRCGLMPNALCIEWEVFEHLRDCAQILDRVKQQTFRDVTKSQVNADMIAGALGLEEVIVAGGMENTANEASTAVLASLWTADNGLLYVKNDSKDLKTPRWANTFHWSQDGSSMGQLVESYESAAIRSIVMRCRADTDEKQMYDECAELLTGLAT
tara:strand:- start:6686 stop:7684 length:999 start_codon:yes stop_codon:yes gene_type:complete